ncbi:hypothetical protein BRADI_1g31816v3 [Brachypodium distachyon]|uniref:Uncharacterized protein n=1 Tax=Brachypodium distachyon TaxID=15368 RepID=A0A0Q3H243_BRADI|nr:hypothetical protein BRADI_1g31816v3 [Brachypodium distachyon]
MCGKEVEMQTCSWCWLPWSVARMAWLCLPCSNLGTEGVLFCAAVIHLLFAGWMGRRLHPLRLLPDTTVTAATRRSFYFFGVDGNGICIHQGYFRTYKALTETNRTNFCSSWVTGMLSSLDSLAEQASFCLKCKNFLCLYRPVDVILFSLLSWIYRIILKPAGNF